MSYVLEKVSIYKYQHEDMQRRLAKLKALEDGGVENWEYYNHALRYWHYEDSKTEAVAQMISDINDIMTEADVDEPAGHGAGYSITFDEEQMAKYLKAYAEKYLEIENAKPRD